FGKVGTKGRGGREPAESAEIEDFRTGTSGPKVCGGHEKPKELRANGISPRVFAANRNKGARISRSRSFSFGTAGKK
ncbi:hypothetical protein KI387_025982, partial [Taxus chinensis]